MPHPGRCISNALCRPNHGFFAGVGQTAHNNARTDRPGHSRHTHQDRVCLILSAGNLPSALEGLELQLQSSELNLARHECFRWCLLQAVQLPARTPTRGVICSAKCQVARILLQVRGAACPPPNDHSEQLRTGGCSGPGSLRNVHALQPTQRSCDGSAPRARISLSTTARTHFLHPGACWMCWVRNNVNNSAGGHCRSIIHSRQGTTRYKKCPVLPSPPVLTGKIIVS